MPSHLPSRPPGEPPPVVVTSTALYQHLAALQLPPETVQTCPTVGDLQALAKRQFRLLARRYHPDAWRGKWSKGDMAHMQRLVAQGCPRWVVQEMYGVSRSHLSAILTGRRRPHGGKSRQRALTFQRIRKAYDWLMRLPAEAVLQTGVIPRRPPSLPRETQYARYCNPLGGGEGIAPRCRDVVVPYGWSVR